jgi:hypothetical protein
MQFIKKHWSTLHLTALGTELFPSPPIRGYRRSSNLREMLTKSTIQYPPIPRILPVDTPVSCSMPNCHYCRLLNMRHGYVRSYISRKTYRVHTHTICQLPNVVYVLSCTKCKVQYVGETKRPIIFRLREHLADIKNRRNQPVSNHFLKSGHLHKHLIPMVLEKIKGDTSLEITTLTRRKAEEKWIYRLRCLTPLGLNVFG